jgi:uncharacterized membrane protein YGL010W
MAGLASYMAQYDHEHASGWNKLLHGIGIPMIFAGLMSLFFAKWVLGGGFFLAGWVLLFLGHRMEGNRPAFFQGPVYLLVGPLWVAKEAWEFLTGGYGQKAPQANSKQK